jgi:MoaA/NifB/PqqE/SkfB family radical SAM enzyme
MNGDRMVSTESDEQRLERIYTSTSTKLLQHMDRLQEARTKGHWRPITLQLAPTDRCNLDCIFCSVKHRNFEQVEGLVKKYGRNVVVGKPKEKPDELSMEQIKTAVEDLMSVGPLKSVEVTGGGDPTMYPQVNELIDYLHGKGLEVGMITNGLLVKKVLKPSTLDKLTWLRVSLSYLDKENFYTPPEVVDDIDLPKIKGVLGFSYVWNEFSTEQKLEKIAQLAERYGVRFVRIVPNCLNVEEQARFKQTVNAHIENINKKFGKEVLFFQTKDYSVHPNCYIGWLKPYLNCDGYFYHCSAVPLYNQKFTPHWRMGAYNEVRKIWSQKGPFNACKCEPGKCFYAEQNRILDSLFVNVPHKNFV